MAFYPTTSIISTSVDIKGNLRLKGNLHLNGNLKGSLHVEDLLRIGQHSQVKGSVKAHSLVLNGCIKGDVITTEETHVLSAGVLNGDIVTSRLCIEEGGRLQGYCRLVSARKI